MITRLNETCFGVNSLTHFWCWTFTDPSRGLSSTLIEFHRWCWNLGPDAWADSVPSRALPIRSSVSAVTVRAVTLCLSWWSSVRFLPVGICEKFVIFATRKKCRSCSCSGCCWSSFWTDLIVTCLTCAAFIIAVTFIEANVRIPEKQWLLGKWIIVTWRYLTSHNIGFWDNPVLIDTVCNTFHPCRHYLLDMIHLMY